MNDAVERAIVLGDALLPPTPAVWDGLDEPARSRCRTVAEALAALPRRERASRVAVEAARLLAPARVAPARVEARLRAEPDDVRRLAASAATGAAAPLAAWAWAAVTADLEPRPEPR